MADATTHGGAPAAGREVQGVLWFTFMVGMWSAFSTLLIAAPETLGEIWSWLTGLPLAAEIGMWILIFPWALGLAVWHSSWEDWLRLLVIALIGAFWTLISKPRAKS